jgi:hypothetical protein
MPALSKFALVFIAACSVSTWATAQKVYKCGSSYSQIPCPDGVAIDAQDKRSSAQKAAATQTSKAQAKQAQALEKERLKDEAQTRAADQARAKAQSKQEMAEDKPAAKKKSKEPEYFTAKSTAAAKK